MSSPLVCSVCGKPAVIYQRHSGRHLCGVHFCADVEEHVAGTIKTHRMITGYDRVAVALSGGKDSTALLLMLSRLLPSFGEVSLVALTVDEGISGYREETIRSAEWLTRKLGIEHHILSFEALFGDSLDTLLKDREPRACTICGILRKKALVMGTQQAGATKLATGHNLDDEAQSVLMNTLRGDLSRLVRDSGVNSSGIFIPRIKPLREISEREIAMYLMLNEAWTDLPECPYSHHALRREVRSLLSGFEYRYPGTMLNLMKSKEKIRQSCSGTTDADLLIRCRICGDPSSGEICQFCSLMQSLGR